MHPAPQIVETVFARLSNSHIQTRKCSFCTKPSKDTVLRTSCEDAQGKLQGKCSSAENARTWWMPRCQLSGTLHLLNALTPSGFEQSVCTQSNRCDKFWHRVSHK